MLVPSVVRKTSKDGVQESKKAYVEILIEMAMLSSC